MQYIQIFYLYILVSSTNYSSATAFSKKKKKVKMVYIILGIITQRQGKVASNNAENCDFQGCFSNNILLINQRLQV